MYMMRISSLLFPLYNFVLIIIAILLKKNTIYVLGYQCLLPGSKFRIYRNVFMCVKI